MPRTVNAFRLLMLCSLICSAAGCFTHVTHLARAEQLRAEKKYPQAIDEYQTYIEQRLKSKNLTPEQNPYFYYLLIGDCYLGMDQPNDAETAYLTAKDHDAKQTIVSSKFRGLAAYFEEKSDFEKAIEVLKKYRTLDPLLFDLDIDRNDKAMIAAEDRAKAK